MNLAGKMSHGPLPDAHSAIEDAPCGLLQTDEEGLILWANRTFCHWIGHDCAGLIGHRRLQDLFTMGGRIFHQTHWAPLLRIQGSISEVKLEIVTRDGQALPVIMNALLQERDGRRIQQVALYVARDRDKYEKELVLSRRRLEEAVAQATKLQAVAKDRALFAEQMMGIVSHDLRNPLQAIQMGSALLARSQPTPAQVAVLGRIDRSADRANRLISELLDFTRARLGEGLALTPRPLRLHTLVHESVDELKLAFPNRVLTHVRIGDDDACSADSDRLVQLIGNLVANAMAYGSQDLPVTVTSRVEPASFSIAVHNHGAPIPQEQLRDLFLPLTRGDHPTGSSRSVGLGLYIVSEIAKAHGGAVSVRSTEVEGTEFKAVFPKAARA